MLLTYGMVLDNLLYFNAFGIRVSLQKVKF
jgi:hypothetical protein